MNKSLVQSQFGRNAASYVTSKVHAKGASLARLVELVKPAPTWQALDVATAAGHTAFAFAPHVAGVVASDITPEMLREAAKLAADKQIANVRFAEADAENLPFADATFDLVTCRIAPHHFPDVQKFVAEVRRVLKPGGTFALVDNISPDAATTPGFDAAALAKAADDYNAFEKRRDPSHGRCLTVRQWRHLLTTHRFALEAEEHLDKQMEFEAWCRNMSVPDDVVPGLRTTLETADPALAAFLRPGRDEAGQWHFVLIEGVFVAKAI